MEVSDGLVPRRARREAAMCLTRTIPRLATIFPHALQTRANIVRSVTKNILWLHTKCRNAVSAEGVLGQAGINIAYSSTRTLVVGERSKLDAISTTMSHPWYHTIIDVADVVDELSKTLISSNLCLQK